MIADVILLALLAAGFFVGFFRGTIRALFAVGGWAVCFVLAGYARQAIGDWLARSASFDVLYANMLGFALLFFAFFVAVLVLVLFSRSPTALARHPLFDDVLGGVIGVVVAVLVIATVKVMLDTYYIADNPATLSDFGTLAEFRRAMEGSAIVGLISNTVIPWLAFLLGPILHYDVRAVMT